MKRSLPHYRAIVAAAQAKGWPLAFRRDLTVHDRAFCKAHDPAKPFLFVLRESGTHTITPDTAPTRWGSPYWIYALPKAFGEFSCEFYWWDGHALTRLSGAAEAADRMAQADQDLAAGVGHGA